MLLNFGMPQIPATTVQSNTPSFDPYAALGFNPSNQYSGFLQQGNQNIYSKDGGLYETYSPRTVYVRGTGMGRETFDPANKSINYGMSGQPSGIGSPLSGWQSQILEDAGTIYQNGQAFRPYTGETPFGFHKTGDEYNLSTVALNSLRPSYTPTTSLGYNPVMSLLAPTPGGQGAGRFLSGDANMALNFSAPTGE